MPIYTYVCKDCGEPLEARQDFSDEPLTECLACGGRLRKSFNAVGVVFKGSGFYRNDSREAVASSNSSDKAAAGAPSRDSSNGSDKKSGSSSDESSSGRSSSGESSSDRSSSDRSSSGESSSDRSSSDRSSSGKSSSDKSSSGKSSSDKPSAAASSG